MKTLDLHGTRHEDVGLRVSRFIESCWLNGDAEAKIITGHSEPMRKIVLEVAEENGSEVHVGGILGVDKTFIHVIF